MIHQNPREQRVEGHSFSGSDFQPMSGMWTHTTVHESGSLTLFLSGPKPKGQSHSPCVCQLLDEATASLGATRERGGIAS